MSARDLRGKWPSSASPLPGCGESPGFSDVEAARSRAAKAAVDDAGLRMSDIDGLCTANLNAALRLGNVVEYLKLRPKFTEGTNIGGRRSSLTCRRRCSRRCRYLRCGAGLLRQRSAPPSSAASGPGAPVLDRSPSRLPTAVQSAFVLRADRAR
jgi:hypothetical protein